MYKFTIHYIHFSLVNQPQIPTEHWEAFGDDKL